MSITMSALNQRLRLSSPPTAGGIFTVAAWVYSDNSGGGWRTIAAYEKSGGTGGILFQIDATANGWLEVYHNVAQLIAADTGAGGVAPGAWHRVAIVSQGWGNSVTIYNGLGWGSLLSQSGTMPADIGGTKILSIGGTEFLGEHWRGNFYGMHVFDSALTTDQLENVWRNSFYSPVPAYASYPMANAGTALLDFSGNSRPLIKPAAGTITYEDLQPHGVSPGGTNIYSYFNPVVATSYYLDPLQMFHML